MIIETDETHIAVAKAYPSQAAAAKMLAISEAQLSRSEHRALPAGARGRHYSPRTILEAAVEYRRRSLNEVAGDLIAYAAKHAPEHEDEIREDVEEFFAEQQTPEINRDKFLEEARRTLPARLYTEVKRAYDITDSAALNYASSD
jgi:hypothetical protein